MLLFGSLFHRYALVGSLLLLPFGWSSELDDLNNIPQHGYVFSPETVLKFTPDETSILDLLGSLIGLSSGDIMSYLSLARMGLGVVETLHTIFLKVFNGTSIDFSAFERPGADRQLLSMFEIITLRLEQIQRGIDGTEASLRQLVRGLPHLVRWEIALDTLESYTQPINNLYHRFTYYQKHKMQVENHTLLDFANSVVSHDTTSIQSLMANIHSLATPNDPPVVTGTRIYDTTEYEVHNRVTTEMSANLRRLLSSRYKGNRLPPRVAKAKMEELSLRPSVFAMLEEAINNYDRCSHKQSPQQLIFGLYALLALTQARGYAMVSFAYNLLKYHDKGQFTVERQLADDLYMHYSSGMLEVTKQSLNRASNAFRGCDPYKYVEGESFVMVTELLQGYIENEVDLNNRGTCASKCENYKHSNVEGCYLPSSQYCGKHRRCKGMVHDCRFFDADAWVCMSNVPYRRYDWVKYESKQLLGNEGDCSNLLKVDSWWRFFYHCSYCLCLCDDPTSITSDRFVSLRPAVSDIAENKVVTGIKFTKLHRVLHIQVQEGKALSQGQIDPASLRWVDIEPISVGTEKFKEGGDYITLMYEIRNFDLDHLKAPKDHVVTGARFRMLGSHVNLEMWVTPINFTTGVTTPELSYWVSNDNTPVMAANPRKEVYLTDPSDSRRSNSESLVDSVSDTFVALQPTSVHTDIAQLTVPFFDAQPVSPLPSSWLEGIQLYHRGAPGFGGFIAFQVFNYNLTRHLEDGGSQDGVVAISSDKL